MDQAVIFLAFANNDDNHLGLLDMERKKVSEILIPLESKQHFQLFREPTTTTADVFKYLSLFKDRLVIFHYGGHAESDKLLLHGEDANSDGIADVLKLQKNLQLVFLNGCSTKDQVKLLLENGIPAVIATSVPINDQKAADFSITFYDALAKQHSIKEAFEMASAFLKTKGQGSAEIYRGVISREQLNKDKDELPWGLYTTENNEKVLDWKLPSKATNEIVVQSSSSKYNVTNVPINEKLTEVLLETLADHSDELEFIQFQAAKGKKVDIRKVRRAIMDSLPSPIGEQIRKLFAADSQSHEKSLDTISNTRLEQLVITYNTITEFVVFTLLAQLWDESVKVKDIFANEIPDAFKHFFLQESGSTPKVNLELIKYLLQVFEEKKLTSFIDELAEIQEAFQSNTAFNEAHDFMQNLLRIIATQETVGAEDLKNYCLLAEIHLGHIFSVFGFSAKYKLATVKGIDLVKKRHEDASFRHYKVILDNVTAGYLDIEEVYPDFTDAKSVLLQKTEEESRTFLNLSPFLIDENALKGEQKSKLFFFSHYDKNSDTYHYNFVNNRVDKLAISDQNYPNVKEDLETFFNDLFKSKIQQL